MPDEGDEGHQDRLLFARRRAEKGKRSKAEIPQLSNAREPEHRLLGKLKHKASCPHEYYPADVWEMLCKVTPGFQRYWGHKLQKKTKMSAEERVGVRALDIFLWSVFLGNNELASVLRTECQEPMRAALLAAKVCLEMAELLPIESADLQTAADEHEDWAIKVLELSANQDAARIMLTALSFHWDRNVIQLALQNKMKRFVAHRHCQNLCDSFLHGDVDPNMYGGKSELTCRAVIKRSHDSTFVWYLILCAIIPGLISSPFGPNMERAPRAKGDLRWFDFYNVPLIKQLNRCIFYSLYVLLYSWVVVVPMLQSAAWTIDLDVISELRPELLSEVVETTTSTDPTQNASTIFDDFEGDYSYRRMLRPRGGGAGGSTEEASPVEQMLRSAYRTELNENLGTPEIVLIVWTLNYILDEWSQWVMKPSSFDVDLWNQYDYVMLTTTSIAFLIRLIAHWSNDEDHVLLDTHGILALNSLLVWCRLLQYLSMHKSSGVLIIMVMEMIKDMGTWVVLSIVFMLAFTTAFLGISATPDGSFQGPIALPAWAMYGEFDTDTVSSWNPSLGPGLLWLYVLVSNVLLVNLLIAMMSDTYTNIKENADIEWKYTRMTNVLEAVERTHPLPPPLSLPVLTLNFIQWAFFGRRWEKPSLDLSGSGKPDDWDTGGVLWVQKRKKEAASRAAIAELRKTKEIEDELGTDARVKRLEGLMQELLVHVESWAEQRTIDAIRNKATTAG
uniref:Ion transport domain-containing protein n=1 Tax=Haptolina ericina TaxID=156174 RepID=A0A7S3B8D3_9EUKA